MPQESLPIANKHPVWEVYDLHRTIRLNVKYYARQLERTERRNSTLEILIAITAPASAAAGFWFFKTDPGVVIWQSFSAITALLAMAKPFLRFADKIKKVEHALALYRALDHDLSALVREINKEQCYAKPQQKMFKAAEGKLRELVVNPPKIKLDEKLRVRFYSEVNMELPEESFYIPEK